MDDLRPYKSLILAQLPDDGSEPVNIVESVVDGLTEVLGLQDEQIITLGDLETVDVADENSPGPDPLYVKFLHYREERTPTWYGGGEELNDTLNHLALACQRKRHVAIYLSDSRKRSAVIGRLGGPSATGLGALTRIQSGLLNAAFVQGPTRTLWLSATHARASVKADSKILAGIDLRDALDPLGDQTYYFTAARSRVPPLKLPVGVSPRGSRIWVGATRNWWDFTHTVARILRHLEETTTPQSRPLPVVASRSTEVPALSEAFELLVLPPELLADDPTVVPVTKELMERWAYAANYEVLPSDEEGQLQAEVHLEGRPVGRLTLGFDTADPQHVRITETQVSPHADAADEDVNGLKWVCGHSDWIKIWFESGHAIADGQIFEIQHRDEPFLAYCWVDLSQYDVDREKFWTGKFPADAAARIGHEASLFCWVKNEWTNPHNALTPAGGWLACDDGAMEIADFIHLDDTLDPPVLCLVHVKAAKSEKKTRGISVSSYEVVTSQAVKNLRFLDRLHLAGGLAQGLDKKIGQLVWYNQAAKSRDEMVTALEQLQQKGSYRRKVVVLQPHVTQSKLEQVRKNPKHKDRGRLRQLDTLLLGAQASCHDLSADFAVFADAY
jgi:hypothetical protein